MGLPMDILRMNVGQIFQTPQLPQADFSGHMIIITGANTGLGFEAAKHFYALKASHLILACRNPTKGEDARKKIVASTEISSANATIEVWPLDLSSNSSVLAFGERMNTLSRLDAFIANAGQDTIQFEKMEGNESLLTVNGISTFLVGMLAIPKLRETGNLQRQQLPRLVFVGSVVHIFAKDQYLREPPPGKIFQTLNDESTADMNDQYHLTKLLVLLGARGLAKRSMVDQQKPRDLSSSTASTLAGARLSSSEPTMAALEVASGLL